MNPTPVAAKTQTMTHKQLELAKKEAVKINSKLKKLEKRQITNKWQKIVIDRAREGLKEIKKRIQQKLNKFII